MLDMSSKSQQSEINLCSSERQSTVTRKKISYSWFFLLFLVIHSFNTCRFRTILSGSVISIIFSVLFINFLSTEQDYV